LPLTRQQHHLAAQHRGFRRFVTEHDERNLLRAFLAWQRELDPTRTQRWWAERWNTNPSNVALWATHIDAVQFRRVPPDHVRVFADLRELAGVTMEEYYRATPAGRNGRKVTGTYRSAAPVVKARR
jgi:hypothetical protein